MYEYKRRALEAELFTIEEAVAAKKSKKQKKREVAARTQPP